MTTTERPLIRVAECLPALALASADSPATVSWTQGTRASVVVFPHLGPCSECAPYLVGLSEINEDLRLWATRLLVVVPAGSHWAAPGAAGSGAGSEYTVLVDADNVARTRVGVSDGDVAVIVADRYGAVYQVSAASADHCLPDPRDLVELAKFIDIQCPECGVPGAEWQLSCPLPLG